MLCFALLCCVSLDCLPLGCVIAVGVGSRNECISNVPNFNMYILRHSVEEAILDTVKWRKDFGISSIHQHISLNKRVVDMVRKGLAYTSALGDKHGRAVMYMKIARNTRQEKLSDYLNLLMYTVER